jgi:hypothetical protein
VNPRVREPTEARTDLAKLASQPGVAERLGYYVYALIDPTTPPSGEIFYVGKGKGDRAYQHARHAAKVDLSLTSKQLKLARIQAIIRKGVEVRVEVIRHRLETEREAFLVEAAVIDALKLGGTDLADLANIVAGHESTLGWRPLEALVAEYGARDAEIDLTHRVMLIRVNTMFEHGMTAEALYEITRKWWRVNPQHRPEYAFAVFQGIVRAVYRIDPDTWEVWSGDDSTRMRGSSILPRKS